MHHKLDVLDGMDSIKLCVGYRSNGNAIDLLPVGAEDAARCIPVYEEMAGWKQSTVGLSDYPRLPVQARAYLERLEEICEIPVDMISTGADRRETIVRRHPSIDGLPPSTPLAEA